jgi:hypothetical protein
LDEIWEDVSAKLANPFFEKLIKSAEEDKKSK